jgi:aminoglycoside/choline kinase family phosphotransferase
MPVSDEELRAGLARALRRPVGAVIRRPHAYRSSYAIEELDVELGGSGPRRIVFKDLAPSALASEAAAAKPAFALDPLREIAVYREVLAPAGIAAPVLLGSIADVLAGRFWLFLEAVEGALLWQTHGSEAWEAAARWLADLHRRPLAGTSQRLLRYDAAWFRRTLRRAVQAAPAGALDHVAAGFDRVVASLLAWPSTFVHGEFYASNVLVQGTGRSTRPRPVDWEMAGVGPGLLDVAALTAGGWSQLERDRLALAYYEAWARSDDPAADDFLLALEHARLHVALQWIGWSPGWSPPRAHAHDWLADALRSAQRLGL